MFTNVIPIWNLKFFPVLASEQETESERSTITNQYFEFYKEEQFEALSRSTLLKILEVREAS